MINFVLVADGDSITAGGAVGGVDFVYPYYVINNHNVGSLNDLYVVNQSVNGAYSADVLSRVSSGVTNFYRSVASIYSVFIGSNDIANATGQVPTLESNVAATWTQLRTAGFKIIAFTVLPRSQTFSSGQTQAGFEADRQTFNSWVRANASLYDALCDVGNDLNYGGYGAPTGSYYLSDGIHPTAATEALIAATYYGPAIQTICSGSISAGHYTRLGGLLQGPLSFVAGAYAGLQQAPAANGPGQSFVINPMIATNTGSSGGLEVGVGGPVASTTEAGIFFKREGTFMGGIQAQVGATSRLAIYGPGTALNSNYGLSLDGSSFTGLNAPAGGSLNLSVGAGTYISLASSVIELFTRSQGQITRHPCNFLTQ